MKERNRLFFCCMAFVSITILSLSFVPSFAYADSIIDNGGSGTSFTGVWGNSGGSSPYGADSYWSRDGATYTWSFSSQPAGTYRVHMWWSAWPSRASSINVSINHTGGPTPVVINQSVNAGQWNSLGEYLFGTSGSVTITAAYGSTVSTCADAVWFEFVSGNTAPTAYIDSITPNPGDPGQLVSFSGHGTDDGSITDYFWESDMDGFLSNQDSFSTYSLSEGVHTISFKVKDDEDVWSEPVTEVLTVGLPPLEVIIDNDGPGTSKDGNWGFSSGANPYGINSRAENTAGATYTFQGAITGYQEVSLWWTYWSSRCSAVPVDIYDGATLLDTVEVSQQQQGLAGQWNVLGTYPFSGTARVVIRAQNGCSACADAVRLVADAPPEMVDVPDVVGFPQSDAETMITAGSLLVGNVTVAPSNTVPEGNVISQSPTAGTSVPEGSVVDLVDSIGEQFEVVIDNRDSQTSQTGTWLVSGGANPYNPIDPDANSFWSRDGSTFTWHFTPPQNGVYEVSMCWTEWSSRSTSVPVDIQHDGGTATVYINQQENGGQWNSQGQYYFQTGTTYDIRVTSQPAPSSTCADAMKFSYLTDGPFVKIAEPSSYYLQTFPDLFVGANGANLELTWKIKFIMDLGTPNERSILDTSEPYEVVFTDVTKKEHTVDVFVVDGSDIEMPGTYSHDQIIQIGIGNYYVAIGDSITDGDGDDDPSDDISLDGRNGGGGFEPILNNLLTDTTGIPHAIINEGVGGITSLGGLELILTYLFRHPESQRFLVQYGTNDSDPWFPIPSGKGLTSDDPGYAGTFKENMQIIIDTINSAGKEVCLSKLPITLGNDTYTSRYDNPDQGERNVWIKEYNDVIDELKNDPLNNVTVIPPDFYSLFNEDVPGGKRYDFEYADNLHPNGTGYRSMANHWLEPLAP